MWISPLTFLIQDYVKFMNYEDFDILSAFSEFNRTYSDIPENHLFILMNHWFWYPFIYFQKSIWTVCPPRRMPVYRMAKHSRYGILQSLSQNFKL